jgi:plasmid maintenance system antidote protein VapI
LIIGYRDKRTSDFAAGKQVKSFSGFELAARLNQAHFFGTTAEFWLNLQSLYEIRRAQHKSGRAIKDFQAAHV